MDSPKKPVSQPYTDEADDVLSFEHNPKQDNNQANSIINKAIEWMLLNSRFGPKNAGSSNSNPENVSVQVNEDCVNNEFTSSAVLVENARTISKPVGVAHFIQSENALYPYETPTIEEIGLWNEVVEVSVCNPEETDIEIDSDSLRVTDNSDQFILDPENTFVCEDVSSEEVIEALENRSSLELSENSYQDLSHFSSEANYPSTSGNEASSSDFISPSDDINKCFGKQKIRQSLNSTMLNESSLLQVESFSPEKVTDSNKSDSSENGKHFELSPMKSFYENEAKNLISDEEKIDVLDSDCTKNIPIAELSIDDNNAAVTNSDMPVLEKVTEIIPEYVCHENPPVLTPEIKILPTVSEPVVGVVHPFNRVESLDSNDSKEPLDLRSSSSIGKRLGHDVALQQSRSLTRSRMEQRCLTFINNSSSRRLGSKSFRTVLVPYGESGSKDKIKLLSNMNEVANVKGKNCSTTPYPPDLNIRQGISSGNVFRVIPNSFTKSIICDDENSDCNTSKESYNFESRLPLITQNHSQKVIENNLLFINNAKSEIGENKVEKSKPSRGSLSHSPLGFESMKMPVKQLDGKIKDNSNLYDNICVAYLNSVEAGVEIDDRRKSLRTRNNSNSHKSTLPSMPLLLSPEREDNIKSYSVNVERAASSNRALEPRKVKEVKPPPSPKVFARSFQRLDLTQDLPSLSKKKPISICKQKGNNFNEVKASGKVHSGECFSADKSGKLENANLCLEICTNTSRMTRSTSKKMENITEHLPLLCNKSPATSLTNKLHPQVNLDNLSLNQNGILEHKANEIVDSASSNRGVHKNSTYNTLEGTNGSSTNQLAIPDVEEIMLDDGDKEVIINSSEIDFIECDGSPLAHVTAETEKSLSSILNIFSKDIECGKVIVEKVLGSDEVSSDSKRLIDKDFDLDSSKENIFPLIESPTCIETEVMTESSDIYFDTNKDLLSEDKTTEKLQFSKLVDLTFYGSDKSSSEPEFPLADINSVSKSSDISLEYQTDSSKEYDSPENLYSEIEKIDEIIDKELNNSVNFDKNDSDIAETYTSEDIVYKDEIQYTNCPFELFEHGYAAPKCSLPRSEVSSKEPISDAVSPSSSEVGLLSPTSILHLRTSSQKSLVPPLDLRRSLHCNLSDSLSVSSTHSYSSGKCEPGVSQENPNLRPVSSRKFSNKAVDRNVSAVSPPSTSAVEPNLSSISPSVSSAVDRNVFSISPAITSALDKNVSSISPLNSTAVDRNVSSISPASSALERSLSSIPMSVSSAERNVSSTSLAIFSALNRNVTSIFPSISSVRNLSSLFPFNSSAVERNVSSISPPVSPSVERIVSLISPSVSPAVESNVSSISPPVSPAVERNVSLISPPVSPAVERNVSSISPPAVERNVSSISPPVSPTVERNVSSIPPSFSHTVEKNASSIPPPVSPAVERNVFSISPTVSPSVEKNVSSIPPPVSPAVERNVSSISPTVSPSVEKNVSSISPPVSRAVEKNVFSISPPVSPNVERNVPSISPPVSSTVERNASSISPTVSPAAEKNVYSISAPVSRAVEKNVSSISPPHSRAVEKNVSSISPPVSPIVERNVPSISPPVPSTVERNASSISPTVSLAAVKNVYSISAPVSRAVEKNVSSISPPVSPAVEKNVSSMLPPISSKNSESNVSLECSNHAENNPRLPQICKVTPAPTVIVSDDDEPLISSNYSGKSSNEISKIIDSSNDKETLPGLINGIENGTSINEYFVKKLKLKKPNLSQEITTELSSLNQNDVRTPLKGSNFIGSSRDSIIQAAIKTNNIENIIARVTKLSKEASLSHNVSNQTTTPGDSSPITLDIENVDRANCSVPILTTDFNVSKELPNKNSRGSEVSYFADSKSSETIKNRKKMDKSQVKNYKKDITLDNTKKTSISICMNGNKKMSSLYPSEISNEVLNRKPHSNKVLKTCNENENSKTAVKVSKPSLTPKDSSTSVAHPNIPEPIVSQKMEYDYEKDHTDLQKVGIKPGSESSLISQLSRDESTKYSVKQNGTSSIHKCVVNTSTVRGKMNSVPRNKIIPKNLCTVLNGNSNSRDHRRYHTEVKKNSRAKKSIKKPLCSETNRNSDLVKDGIQPELKENICSENIQVISELNSECIENKYGTLNDKESTVNVSLIKNQHSSNEKIIKQDKVHDGINRDYSTHENKLNKKHKCLINDTNCVREVNSVNIKKVEVEISESKYSQKCNANKFKNDNEPSSRIESDEILEESGSSCLNGGNKSTDKKVVITNQIGFHGHYISPPIAESQDDKIKQDIKVSGESYQVRDCKTPHNGLPQLNSEAFLNIKNNDTRDYNDEKEELVHHKVYSSDEIVSHHMKEIATAKQSVQDSEKMRNHTTTEIYPDIEPNVHLPSDIESDSVLFECEELSTTNITVPSVNRSKGFPQITNENPEGKSPICHETVFSPGHSSYDFPEHKLPKSTIVIINEHRSEQAIASENAQNKTLDIEISEIYVEKSFESKKLFSSKVTDTCNKVCESVSQTNTIGEKNQFSSYSFISNDETEAITTKTSVENTGQIIPQATFKNSEPTKMENVDIQIMTVIDTCDKKTLEYDQKSLNNPSDVSIEIREESMIPNNHEISEAKLLPHEKFPSGESFSFDKAISSNELIEDGTVQKPNEFKVDISLPSVCSTQHTELEACDKVITLNNDHKVELIHSSNGDKTNSVSQETRENLINEVIQNKKIIFSKADMPLESIIEVNEESQKTELTVEIGEEALIPLQIEISEEKAEFNETKSIVPEQSMEEEDENHEITSEITQADTLEIQQSAKIASTFDKSFQNEHPSHLELIDSNAQTKKLINNLKPLCTADSSQATTNKAFVLNPQVQENEDTTFKCKEPSRLELNERSVDIGKEGFQEPNYNIADHVKFPVVESLSIDKIEFIADQSGETEVNEITTEFNSEIVEKETKYVSHHIKENLINEFGQNDKFISNRDYSSNVNELKKLVENEELPKLEESLENIINTNHIPEVSSNGDGGKYKNEELNTVLTADNRETLTPQISEHQLVDHESKSVLPEQSIDTDEKHIYEVTCLDTHADTLKIQQPSDGTSFQIGHPSYLNAKIKYDTPLQKNNDTVNETVLPSESLTYVLTEEIIESVDLVSTKDSPEIASECEDSTFKSEPSSGFSHGKSENVIADQSLETEVKEHLSEVNSEIVDNNPLNIKPNYIVNSFFRDTSETVVAHQSEESDVKGLDTEVNSVLIEKEPLEIQKHTQLMTCDNRNEESSCTELSTETQGEILIPQLSEDKAIHHDTESVVTEQLIEIEEKHTNEVTSDITLTDTIDIQQPPESEVVDKSFQDGYPSCLTLIDSSTRIRDGTEVQEINDTVEETALRSESLTHVLTEKLIENVKPLCTVNTTATTRNTALGIEPQVSSETVIAEGSVETEVKELDNVVNSGTIKNELSDRQQHTPLLTSDNNINQNECNKVESLNSRSATEETYLSDETENNLRNEVTKCGTDTSHKDDTSIVSGPKQIQGLERNEKVCLHKKPLENIVNDIHIPEESSSHVRGKSCNEESYCRELSTETQGEILTPQLSEEKSIHRDTESVVAEQSIEIEENHTNEVTPDITQTDTIDIQQPPESEVTDKSFQDGYPSCLTLIDSSTRIRDDTEVQEINDILKETALPSETLTHVLAEKLIENVKPLSTVNTTATTRNSALDIEPQVTSETVIAEQSVETKVKELDTVVNSQTIKNELSDRQQHTPLLTRDYNTNQNECNKVESLNSRSATEETYLSDETEKILSNEVTKCGTDISHKDDTSIVSGPEQVQGLERNEKVCLHKEPLENIVNDIHIPEGSSSQIRGKSCNEESTSTELSTETQGEILTEEKSIHRDTESVVNEQSIEIEENHINEVTPDITQTDTIDIQQSPESEVTDKSFQDGYPSCLTLIDSSTRIRDDTEVQEINDILKETALPSETLTNVLTEKLIENVKPLCTVNTTSTTRNTALGIEPQVSSETVIAEGSVETEVKELDNVVNSGTIKNELSDRQQHTPLLTSDNNINQNECNKVESLNWRSATEETYLSDKTEKILSNEVTKCGTDISHKDDTSIVSDPEQIQGLERNEKICLHKKPLENIVNDIHIPEESSSHVRGKSCNEESYCRELSTETQGEILTPQLSEEKSIHRDTESVVAEQSIEIEENHTNEVTPDITQTDTIDIQQPPESEVTDKSFQDGYPSCLTLIDSSTRIRDETEVQEINDIVKEIALPSETLSHVPTEKLIGSIGPVNTKDIPKSTSNNAFDVVSDVNVFENVYSKCEPPSSLSHDTSETVIPQKSVEFEAKKLSSTINSETIDDKLSNSQQHTGLMCSENIIPQNDNPKIVLIDSKPVTKDKFVSDQTKLNLNNEVIQYDKFTSHKDHSSNLNGSNQIKQLSENVKVYLHDEPLENIINNNDISEESTACDTGESLNEDSSCTELTTDIREEVLTPQLSEISEDELVHHEPVSVATQQSIETKENHCNVVTSEIMQTSALDIQSATSVTFDSKSFQDEHHSCLDSLDSSSNIRDDTIAHETVKKIELPSQSPTHVLTQKIIENVELVSTEDSPEIASNNAFDVVPSVHECVDSTFISEPLSLVSHNTSETVIAEQSKTEIKKLLSDVISEIIDNELLDSQQHATPCGSNYVNTRETEPSFNEENNVASNLLNGVSNCVQDSSSSATTSGFANAAPVSGSSTNKIESIVRSYFKANSISQPSTSRSSENEITDEIDDSQLVLNRSNDHSELNGRRFGNDGDSEDYLFYKYSPRCYKAKYNWTPKLRNPSKISDDSKDDHVPCSNTLGTSNYQTSSAQSSCSNKAFDNSGNKIHSDENVSSGISKRCLRVLVERIDLQKYSSILNQSKFSDQSKSRKILGNIKPTKRFRSTSNDESEPPLKVHPGNVQEKYLSNDDCKLKIHATNKKTHSRNKVPGIDSHSKRTRSLDKVSGYFEDTTISNKDRDESKQYSHSKRTHSLDNLQGREKAVSEHKDGELNNYSHAKNTRSQDKTCQERAVSDTEDDKHTNYVNTKNSCLEDRIPQERADSNNESGKLHSFSYIKRICSQDKVLVHSRARGEVSGNEHGKLKNDSCARKSYLKENSSLLEKDVTDCNTDHLLPSNFHVDENQFTQTHNSQNNHDRKDQFKHLSLTFNKCHSTNNNNIKGKHCDNNISPDNFNGFNSNSRKHNDDVIRIAGLQLSTLIKCEVPKIDNKSYLKKLMREHGLRSVVLPSQCFNSFGGNNDLGKDYSVSSFCCGRKIVTKVDRKLSSNNIINDETGKCRYLKKANKDRLLEKESSKLVARNSSQRCKKEISHSTKSGLPLLSGIDSINPQQNLATLNTFGNKSSQNHLSSKTQILGIEISRTPVSLESQDICENSRFCDKVTNNSQKWTDDVDNLRNLEVSVTQDTNFETYDPLRKRPLETESLKVLNGTAIAQESSKKVQDAPEAKKRALVCNTLRPSEISRKRPNKKFEDDSRPYKRQNLGADSGTSIAGSCSSQINPFLQESINERMIDCHESQAFSNSQRKNNTLDSSKLLPFPSTSDFSSSLSTNLDENLPNAFGFIDKAKIQVDLNKLAERRRNDLIRDNLKPKFVGFNPVPNEFCPCIASSFSGICSDCRYYYSCQKYIGLLHTAIRESPPLRQASSLLNQTGHHFRVSADPPLVNSSSVINQSHFKGALDTQLIDQSSLQGPAPLSKDSDRDLSQRGRSGHRFTHSVLKKSTNNDSSSVVCSANNDEDWNMPGPSTSESRPSRQCKITDPGFYKSKGEQVDIDSTDSSSEDDFNLENQDRSWR